MNDWTPFYDYDYVSTQVKVVGWLFMMFSYNEVYPDTFCPYFGEKVKRFALSENRQQTEWGNGLALNKTPRQLFRATLNRGTTPEIECYRDSLAKWVGQLFVMLNWRFGIPHEELATIDWNEVYKSGVVLHEASCVNACKKVIRKYNLIPRGEDTRMKF